MNIDDGTQDRQIGKRIKGTERTNGAKSKQTNKEGKKLRKKRTFHDFAEKIRVDKMAQQRRFSAREICHCLNLLKFPVYNPI